MKNCIVAVAGDLHVNSTVALCPPKFNLDDGGTYVASKQQRFIWNHWIDYWNHIRELKQQGNYYIYAVLNGDIADDLNHKSTQLITKNEADIISLTVIALNPVLEVADSIIVIRGTEAHVRPSASIEEIIANEIGAVRDSDTDQAARWLYRDVINGVKLHVTHHPGMGHMREWTRGGDANRLAAQIFMRYASMRVDYPDLAIFGHNHKPVDSYDNHPTRAVVLPSWQLTNAFGYRLGGGWLPVGGAYITIDDSGYEVHKHYKQWPIASWKQTTTNLHMTN